MDEQQADVKRAGMLKRLFAVLGPGLITAAVVLGPGSVTVSTLSGARMGYSVLWVLLTAGIMMVAFTYLGAKIGMLARDSLLTTTAQKYGRAVAALIGLSGFLIATGFQTGDNAGVGIALAEMFGGTMEMWAVVFTVVAMALLWHSNRIYKVLERMMVVLVVVMMVAFVANLLRIRPSGVGIAKGLIPSKPAIFYLVVAISATTFSVAAAAFQPYLVRSKGWTQADVKKGLRDAFIGIMSLVTISAIIMITAATVLKPKGIEVKSAFDMALQLEPLLGEGAKWLFLSGLWAASFSSFIVNAMVGGTLLADGLGIGDRLDSFWSKTLASAVMIFGTVAAILFGARPMNLIVMAQAATILGVPLIAVIMWLLTNDRKLMGKRKNGLALNALILVAIGWLLFLSVRQFLSYFGK